MPLGLPVLSLCENRCSLNRELQISIQRGVYRDQVIILNPEWQIKIFICLRSRVITPSRLLGKEEISSIKTLSAVLRRDQLYSSWLQKGVYCFSECPLMRQVSEEGQRGEFCERDWQIQLYSCRQWLSRTHCLKWYDATPERNRPGGHWKECGCQMIGGLVCGSPGSLQNDFLAEGWDWVANDTLWLFLGDPEAGLPGRPRGG